MRAIVVFDDNPAILRCSGDEDRITQSSRRPAITRAIRSQADVIVDLTDLTFADSSLMVDFAVLARRLRTHDRKVRLRGAQPNVRRLIELVGLHRLPGVMLEGPSPALA